LSRADSSQGRMSVLTKSEDRRPKSEVKSDRVRSKLFISIQEGEKLP
jgi:hypothetical protein